MNGDNPELKEEVVVVADQEGHLPREDLVVLVSVSLSTQQHRYLIHQS